MTAVFALAVFLGAALMFWVEPLVGRILLPLLGGTPAVWNTCMVFFQAALLAGYALAHALTAWTGPRTRLALHAALLVLPLAALPLALPAGATAQLARGAEPFGWLCATLAATVGLPFLALAATTPLLQDWAAHSGHEPLADPYPLYGLSNAGSLAALLAFPFLFEPRMTIASQLAWWSRAYVAYAALGVLAAAWAARKGRVRSRAEEGAREPARPIGISRAVRWVALAVVPSSLLLGVTAHLSLDIAAVPLLWVLPLGIYLMTFVLAFARRPPVTARGIDRAVPALIVAIAVTLSIHATHAVWVPVHLAAFGAIALMCHLRLAEDRPGPQSLTVFYLCLSLGGVLGGLFNALVAPLAFSRLEELPIALVAACLVRPPPEPGAPSTGIDGWLALFVGAVGFLMWLLGLFAGEGALDLAVRAAILVPLFGSFVLAGRPVRFAFAIAALLATAELRRDLGDEVLHRERTFFGVLRVVRTTETRRQKLIHGQILHGMQRIEEDGSLEPEPLVYYHREGPCADIFETLGSLGRPTRAGLVGLGAGSVAAYARPGDRWTFYEIDPAVIDIARNPAYFNFLARAHAERIVTIAGDARLKLREAPAREYDLILLDAFSSDAVPVHLLTREALDLYLDKLAPGGLIAFHISNMYLDLEPLLAALAEAAHLEARVRNDATPGLEEQYRGMVASSWAVLARSERALGPLARKYRWRRLEKKPGLDAWTDDRSSILSILR